MVLWQNTRVKVLHDFTYIVEIAYRITLGDVPYRDFVIPHAPLTFLFQALAMSVHDGSLWPQAWCSAVMAGGTAVFTYWIVRIQLAEADGAGTAFTAFMLSAPTVFLNGYAILSQPFYDSDCVFLVLLALTALLSARRREPVFWRYFLAGVLLAVPLVAKQNIGVAAFFAIHGCVFISALAGDRPERRAYAIVVSGSIAGLLALAAAIHIWTGISNYWHWTVTYAGARRWPSSRLVLSPYREPRTWVAVVCAVAGYALVRRHSGSRWLVLIGLSIIALPLIDAIRTMLRWAVSIRAFVLWGLGSIGALLLWLSRAVQSKWRFEGALPLVAIAVAHAAFTSQGVIDSSYAVWPLLMIALAGLAGQLLRAAAREQRRVVHAFIVFVGAAFALVGYQHVARAERLGYADLSGAVEHASVPVLQGLSTPGTYISDFERLLRRTHELIPRGDSVVLIPGEDPYFFASKRRPRFPLILFDDTAVPYDTATLLQMLTDRDVTWIIVKRRLQLLNRPWRPLESFVDEDLPPRYEVVEEIPRYTILKRRARD